MISLRGEKRLLFLLRFWRDFRSKSRWATESRSLLLCPGISPAGQQDGFSGLFFFNGLVFLI